MNKLVPSSILDSLTIIDWSIFGFVNVLSFSLLLFVRKKTKIENKDFDWLDYLLMGRKLSLPFFIASLVATWYGGIFGVTRISFESGIFNFITQGFFWYLSYFVFAFFLVKKIRKSKAVTLAEMIGMQYGPKSERIAAVFNFFNVVPVVYTISLGILLNNLFGLSFNLSCLLGLSLVFIYTSVGGLRAVVLTDFIQFVLMFLGVGAVLYFSIYTYGGLSFLTANLPVEHFSLTGGHSIGETLAWGFIAFSTLVDPNFYHRVFAAKDYQTAQKGIVISIGFWLKFDICTTFGAMYARAIMPEADSNSAYLIYALNLLPEGFRGLFLGGIVACIISTLDSYVFTASNTLLYDLFPKKHHLKKINHIFSNIFVCSLAFVMASLFEGNIKLVWKTLGSYSAACLLLPVILSQFSKLKITDSQFVSSSLISALGVSIWRNIEIPYYSDLIDELYIGVLLSCFCFMYFSLLTKRSNRI